MKEIIKLLELHIQIAVEAQSPDGLNCALSRKYFKGREAGLRVALEEIKKHEDKL